MIFPNIVEMFYFFIKNLIGNFRKNLMKFLLSVKTEKNTNILCNL